jgi:hypothetical protein
MANITEPKTNPECDWQVIIYYLNSTLSNKDKLIEEKYSYIEYVKDRLR